LRAFIALNLPDADRHQLHEAAQPIREAAGAGVGSWVAPSNLHLTLKFLGEIDVARAGTVADGLRRIATAHRPVTLQFEGAGVFPNLRTPRIVWMGVAPDARLELLYHDVERACDALGFAVEGRAFRPHITFGRLKARPDASGRRALETAVRELSVARRIVVETVDLMASTLGSGGSTYTVLTAAPLGEGEDR
jgi:2'-5' RNA ligase